MKPAVEAADDWPRYLDAVYVLDELPTRVLRVRSGRTSNCLQSEKGRINSAGVFPAGIAPAQARFVITRYRLVTTPPR